MTSKRRPATWLTAFVVCWGSSIADAGTFYYTGPSAGDFFNEANWKSAPNGTGTSPAADSINPDVGFLDNLIIDGDNVTAEANLDIGAGGSLDLLTGSELNVIDDFFSAQFEVSTGGFFSLTDSMLAVADDIFLHGSTVFTGGTVRSFGDDIEFISSDTTINGTTFISGDSILIRAELTPAVGSSIVGAQFSALSRLGIREFDMTVTDSTFNLVADVEDATACTDLDCATATLTLLGNSSVTADQIQEGVRVVIDDNSIVTLTNEEFETDDDELTWLTQASTRVTLNSPNAQLVLQNSQNEASDFKIFAGVTGLSYSEHPDSWDPNDWTGAEAVTLKVIEAAKGPDFDNDGDVDGDDFLTWQRGYGLAGQTDNSTGDATGEGDVTGIDLLSWERKYGSVVASAVSSFSVVPEPTTYLLFVLAMTCCLACRVNRA